MKTSSLYGALLCTIVLPLGVIESREPTKEKDAKQTSEKNRQSLKKPPQPIVREDRAALERAKKEAAKQLKNQPKDKGAEIAAHKQKSAKKALEEANRNKTAKSKSQEKSATKKTNQRKQPADSALAKDASGHTTKKTSKPTHDKKKHPDSNIHHSGAEPQKDVSRRQSKPKTERGKPSTGQSTTAVSTGKAVGPTRKPSAPTQNRLPGGTR